MVTISHLVYHDTLFQNAADNTKCDKSLLQNKTKAYSKMHQVFYYKMGQFYYKIRRLLQNVSILLQNATVTLITKCDITIAMKYDTREYSLHCNGEDLVKENPVYVQNGLPSVLNIFLENNFSVKSTRFKTSVV